MRLAVAVLAISSTAYAEPSWTKVATAPKDLALVNVSIAPGKDLVAGANTRRQPDGDEPGRPGYALRLHDGSWKRTQVFGVQRHGAEMVGVWWAGDGLAEAHWMPHGDVGTAQLSSDGVHWTAAKGEDLSFRPRGAWWSGKLGIVAAGSDGIMRTSDGGHTWQSLDLGREPVVWAVWGSDAELFAMGRSVWHSTDRGAHWSELHVKLRVEISSLTGSGKDLYAYAREYDKDVAHLMHSTDGIAWDERSMPDKFAPLPGAAGDATITFADGALWLAGKGVWRSGDGGKTWVQEPLPAGDYPVLVAAGAAIYAVRSAPSGDAIYKRE
jgi:hypothetical protein